MAMDAPADTDETTTDRREGVVRGTATVLVTYVGTAGFTAVLTLYLVRALGPTEYGYLALAGGVAGMLALAADFGIAASASRFMAEQLGDRRALARLFADATRLKLIVAGGVAAVLFAGAGAVADVYDEPALAWPVRALAVALLLHSVFTLFSSVFIAIRRTALNLRMVLVESASELGATVALVAAGAGATGAATGRAIGYGIGAAFGLLLAVRLLGRGAAAVHRRGSRRMGQLRQYALTLWLVNGAFTIFSQLDLIVIGAVLDAAAVGAFAAPLRLTILLGYPGLAIANGVTPRLARKDGEPADTRTLQHAFRVMVVVQAVMVAPLVVWAEPIVTLLLGSEYEDSVAVLRWMTIFIFLQGFAALASLAINYVGEARRRIPWAVGAVVVNLAIDLTLLRPLGVEAAAIGTSVAYALYVGGHVWLCRELLDVRLRPLALSVARSAAAVLAMTGVLAAFGTSDLSPAAWVAGLVLATAAFGGILLALREVTPDELRRLRDRFPSRQR
jgi:O-antigen/teichoic acid export membrane protein